MNDTLILVVGAVAFGLMIVGVILTIVEFRRKPRYQKPRYESVAFQAQPSKPGKEKSSAR